MRISKYITMFQLASKSMKISQYRTIFQTKTLSAGSKRSFKLPPQNNSQTEHRTPGMFAYVQIRLQCKYKRPGHVRNKLCESGGSILMDIPPLHVVILVNLLRYLGSFLHCLVNGQCRLKYKHAYSTIF
uniref:Uncharacterized protein n=1 Tax=Sphaerodactylus townsendi TaxID=933632 RepID=A0ACB8E850_9SAUR